MDVHSVALQTRKVKSRVVLRPIDFATTSFYNARNYAGKKRMAFEYAQGRSSMKQRFDEIFNECVDRYFPLILSEYSLQAEKIITFSGTEYQMENKYLLLTVSFYNSHRISVATSFKRPGCSCRVFGLNLIMQVLNPDFSLGSEDIQTEQELDYAVQQHAAAIKRYCSDLLNGDFSQWSMLEDYAEKKLKEEIS